MLKAYYDSLPLGLPLGLPLEYKSMPLGACVCHWAPGHGSEAPGQPKKPHGPRREQQCTTISARNAPEGASELQRTPGSRKLRPERASEAQRTCCWRPAAPMAYAVPQWHTQCHSGIPSAPVAYSVAYPSGKPSGQRLFNGKSISERSSQRPSGKPPVANSP